jgi:uncharacterized delta-60 repeat protein
VVAIVLAGACAATGAAAHVPYAATRAGSVDPSFGSGGKVVIPIPLLPTAALVQPDGRILVAGNLGAGPGQIAVVRLLPSGRLDRSFGGGGVGVFSMFAANSLTLQPDGKMIVAGTAASGHDAELVRIRKDGKLDTVFGNNGVVVFDYVANSSNGALVVVVAPDGKLVAGGFGLATTSDAYLTSLARFKPDGSPDTTFGTNGGVAVDLVGGVTAVGLQSDGKVLTCGGFITSATSLVVRFLQNGTVDRSNAGGSLVSVAHTGSGTFGGTNEFQLDGKLVQWTTVTSPSGNRHSVKILRRLRDNTPDPSFTSVSFAFKSPAFNTPSDVEIAPDGALLVTGAGSTGPADTVFGLARLLPGGELDGSFGRAGRVVTRFSGSDKSTALAFQSDGKIVLAGVTTHGSASALALARYLGK